MKPINNIFRSMRKNPEQKKLQKYSEAMSKLDSDEQLNKMAAVKSTETLKRFLSEDSPDVLVHRFSARLKDISDEDLNDYEMGRVLFELGKHEAAIRYFMYALEKGEERANYYLGMLLISTPDDARVMKHLEKAVRIGQMSDLAAYYLAEFYLKALNFEKALYFFHSAYELAGPSRKKFYDFRIRFLNGESPNPEEELTDLMNKGDLPTCMTMLKHFQTTGNKAGQEYVYQQLIKAGYVKFYVLLARFYKDHNEVDKAADAFRNAIKAGYTEHHINLINYMMANKKYEDAYDACLNAINGRMYYAYILIIAICAHLGKHFEMIKLISDAFYKNVQGLDSLLDSLTDNPAVFAALKTQVVKALAEGTDLHPIIIEKFFADSSGRENRDNSFGFGNGSNGGQMFN